MTHFKFFDQGQEIEEVTNIKFLLFVNNTSVLIIASNLSELQIKCTNILNYMSTWFAVNGLTLSIKKINALYFKSNHLQNESFQFFLLRYRKQRSNEYKISWTMAYKRVEWNTNVELMIPKMSSACYAVRSVYSFSDMTAH
jgi:hypothetical protein